MIGERRGDSSSLSSPPSSRQNPTTEQSPDQGSCHTPSESPPRQDITVQLQAQVQPTATAPRKTDQILIPNYLETLADSAIDPSLKHLTDTFNVESTASPRNQTQGDVQGGTETGDDFSWLPDFKNTISQSNALTLYPWPLDTTLPFIPSTQPTSSDTGSPASSFPNGPPGSVKCPNNVDNGMIDSSPSTSASDHGGIAGRVGISSTSSESGLEAGGTKDDTVPPPPKKKSHARKVCRRCFLNVPLLTVSLATGRSY